jgi:hypothetical protein
VWEETQALGVEKCIHECAEMKVLHSELAAYETWPEKWWLRWISVADGSGGDRVWFLVPRLGVDICHRERRIRRWENKNLACQAKIIRAR